ncbi:helical hairpin domain-containing protein [Lactococcus raffinolactis]|uniref:helical hairpin domain-containing protein n=2 Tax=Pseudolactococcus TaxID=3436058 RepID=UPI0020B15B54|nr:relaxase/mobilization nuclease domain-containing protein [Lactococcus raffinolactis]
MVVVKTMQIKTPERLTRSVKYILNPKKTNVPYVETDKDFPVTFSEDKKLMQLVSGHKISNVNFADQEFFLTKIMANASNGNPDNSDMNNPNRVMAHHIVQAFPPDSKLTPEEIHELGRKTVLELTGGDHEFIVATHVDQDHIHNHIIFNTTNSTTLKKFRWQKGTAKSLKYISDKHADIAGAKILSNTMKNSHKKYSAYQRKNNFKLEIKERLNFLLKHSTSITDFKEKAKALNMIIDDTGKNVKYRLADMKQIRNTRDDTLSKRGKYAMSNIEKIVSKNMSVFSLPEIKNEYDKFKKEKDDDFEMKILVEDWQVKEETKNGIYIDIDYGLLNGGSILIPSHQVNKIDDGNYNIFIKKKDYFYFTNSDDASKNKFMTGNTVAKQLSRDNQHLVLHKNQNISKLDQIIKDFEYLSLKGVSTGSQFSNLKSQFEIQVHETEKELSQLDDKISRLNKIISAIDGLNSGDFRKIETSEAILSDLKINRSTKKGDLNKTIEEVKFERQVLNDRFNEIVESYKVYQSVKENVRDREVEKSNYKSL